MTLSLTYGKGARMLTLGQLCEWLNITERHARKLVERNAIPYRKVGHLLRFPEAEIEVWSHPERDMEPGGAVPQSGTQNFSDRGTKNKFFLPKSLIE